MEKEYNYLQMEICSKEVIKMVSHMGRDIIDGEMEAISKESLKQGSEQDMGFGKIKQHNTKENI